MRIPSLVFAAVVFAVGVAGCLPKKKPDNQTQRLVSPSGKYVLTLPIEKSRSPQYADTPVWKVTIHDSAGALEYKDDDSTLVGTFNVYWAWDQKDRVWVYNSDNGRISRWEKRNLKWSTAEVAETEKKEAPDSLLPDYAR